MSITVRGRIMATLTAFAGIGVIAAPTGILAAALSDALAKARHDKARARPGAHDEEGSA